MNSVKKCYIGVALTGLLSACSGGGGGSDGNSAPAPAAPATSPVLITSTNAAKVSAEAYFGVVDTRDFGANGLGSTGISASVVNVNTDAGFDLFTFTQQIISRLPELDARLGSDVVSAVVIPPETFQCENGGTLTISREASDPEAFTAGDTVDVVLANCNDLSGLLNGQVSLRFNSISQNSSDEVTGFDATLTMTDFSVVFAGETWTSNGDITTVISDVSDDEVSAILSGNSFIVTRGNQSSTLRSFSIAEIRNTATGAASTDTSGVVESIAMGGSASFETVENFQRNITDEYPFTGSALIRGANGSSTLITALDSVNVRLDIDANGDDSFEESIETTWVALGQL